MICIRRQIAIRGRQEGGPSWRAQSGVVKDDKAVLDGYTVIVRLFACLAYRYCLLSKSEDSSKECFETAREAREIRVHFEPDWAAIGTGRNGVVNSLHKPWPQLFGPPTDLCTAPTVQAHLANLDPNMRITTSIVSVPT